MLQNLISQYMKMREAYNEISQGCNVVIAYSLTDYFEYQQIAYDILVKMMYIKGLIASLDFYTYLHLD